MRRGWLTAGVLALALAACSGGSDQEHMTSNTNATLTVSAAEFQPNGTIPDQNSASGGNHPPTLTWSGVPDGAKSIAVVADDTDAHGFVHWLAYNIPPSSHGVPAGAPQGKNSSGGVGYFGPKPPPGSPHHYHFHVYALDQMLPIQPGASQDDVNLAMRGHILAQGELVGTYQTK